MKRVKQQKVFSIIFQLLHISDGVSNYSRSCNPWKNEWRIINTQRFKDLFVAGGSSSLHRANPPLRKIWDSYGGTKSGSGGEWKQEGDSGSTDPLPPCSFCFVFDIRSGDTVLSSSGVESIRAWGMRLTVGIVISQRARRTPSRSSSIFDRSTPLLSSTRWIGSYLR